MRLGAVSAMERAEAGGRDATCRPTRWGPPGGPARNAKLNGAYLIKSVAYRANFESADVSDALFDRAVLVEANSRTPSYSASSLPRSDLKDAIIEGADFTNSLVDKTQQITLCRYASGTNPVTGVDTRKSLGCGSKRRYAASVPSNPEGPQVAEDEEEAFRATMPVFYRL